MRRKKTKGGGSYGAKRDNILFFLRICAEKCILSETPVRRRRFAGAKFAGRGDNVFIGKNVSFGGEVFLYSTAQISIGPSTMIGYGTVIHTSTHNYNDHPMWFKRIDRPVKIGEHVWIGTRAVILPGVVIHDYAVVGAGSVVNANVPEGAIVAGNPARVVGYRKKGIYVNRIPVISSRNDCKRIKMGYLDK